MNYWSRGGGYPDLSGSTTEKNTFFMGVFPYKVEKRSK